MQFNPLNYHSCFEKPLRLTNLNAWHEHIPFAFAVMQMLKPKIFVELGTHKGDSYCAFCQTVEILKLPTACYAIDTWEGDEHSGFYEPKVLEELRAYHDPLYGHFSQLIQSRFDNALNYFSNGGIDLLHIDGLHTYEAVKHDFETWLPKISKSGVVLIHDINVREREFGVWQLWEELKESYPSFEFKHGHGLGVLAVGTEIPEEVMKFFDMEPNKKIICSNFFSYMGNKITLFEIIDSKNNWIDELTTANKSKDAQITEQIRLVHSKDAEINLKDVQLAELANLIHSKDAQITEITKLVYSKEAQITEINKAIQQSLLWRLMMIYQRFIDKLLPSGTSRRKYYNATLNWIRKN